VRLLLVEDDPMIGESIEDGLRAEQTDAFNTQRQRRLFETSTFIGNYRRQQMGQIAYIGLSYNFGGGHKAKDADFNYE